MLIHKEQMVQVPQLLLIGGNTRHIGKTTLACEIIKTFAGIHPVTAFKITSIYIDDEKYHGRHEHLASVDYRISRELTSSNSKDTAKMLGAGASESYFIQSFDNAVERAWDEFFKLVPKHHMLLCESRSLRRFVEPGLFIYLKSSNIENEKPHHLWLEKLADLVLVDPNHMEISDLVRRMKIIRNCWKIF